MLTTLFAFATDLHDEGVDVVLDNVSDRAAVGGVTVASSYHHGRDIFPHSPVRKVRFLEGGAVFFRPEAQRYTDGRIQPHVSRLAQEADVLGDLRAATDRRGLAVNAWTVFLHNTTLATRYPDCAVRNAFGDPHLTDLCPANPEVRRYVVTLAADLMRYRPDVVLAESLHYHPLEHGYHHERYFIELGPTASFLLGVCFCDHCLRRARENGVDADAVLAVAREWVQEAFESRPPDADDEDVSRDGIAGLAGGEFSGYLAMRRDAVTSLAAEIAGAVDAAGGRFAFMDLSGAVKGYATGRPTGDAAPSIAWRLGVDIGELAEACHEIQAIGYAAEVERLRFDLEGYRSLADGNAGIAVALRPMAPDCDTSENLAAKFQLCRELGLERADLYHYGFMRLDTLDRVREAVEAARPSANS